MDSPYLSVVIPAYNEETRLGDSLVKVINFLRRQPFSSEIVIVDDGSTDRTVAIACDRLGDFPHTILKNEVNRGKGFTVKKGMLSGKGRFILFSDADLSTPIEEVIEFLKHLEAGYDVVIGSRALKDSQVVKHQPFWRERLGRLFNWVARMLAFHGIHDSQCGFKCFRREAAQDLFGLQKLERFSFDVEIVYLAQRRGYKILEKAVLWKNSPQSRVRIWIDPLNMIFDMMRIRWLHRRLV